MDDLELTPAIVTALSANQDPTLDDSVDIDVSNYIDVGNGSTVDITGNVATDDTGQPGILSIDSEVIDNPLPEDVEQETDPPINGFSTDGWEPVNYTYDENGNFINLDVTDDGLQPNFSSEDILTSSDF